MPATSVITRGRYVSSWKSSGAPIGFHSTGRPVEQRRAGGEAERGQRERRHGDGARAVGGQRHEPAPGDRLALEGAGHPAVERVLALGVSASVSHGRGRNNIDARPSPGAPGAAGSGRGQRAGAAARSWRAAPSAPARAAAFAASSSGPDPWPDRGGAGGPHRGGPLGVALGVRLGGERDDVGQLGDGVEVAELGQAGEPERVEAVAGEQREVRVVRAASTRPVAVVLQVALDDRLDEQLVVVLVAGGARARTRPRRPACRRPAPGRRPRRPSARRCAARCASALSVASRGRARRRLITRSRRTPPRRPRACG